MQTLLKSLMFVAAMLITMDVSAQPIELAQTAKQKCLHTCMEQYGADKKSACAVQCGYGGSASGGAPARDCGVIYKQCLKSCGKNKKCKNTCRKQRTTCY